MYSSFRLIAYRTKFHIAPYSYGGVYREVWPKLNTDGKVHLQFRNQSLLLKKLETAPRGPPSRIKDKTLLMTFPLAY
jgi:hypothetical protein